MSIGFRMNAAVCVLVLGCIQAVSPAGDDAGKLNRVVVQGFEDATAKPRVWVVGVPNETASIELSDDHAKQGKRSLKLHYEFTGPGQYLGVDVPVRINAPIAKLSFMLRGDNSGSGYGVYLLDGSGETRKFRDAGKMKIDFTGWREITIDNVNARGEAWGGDKNGKVDYPVTRVVFEISTPGKAVKGDLYFDALSVDSAASADQITGGQVSVVSPAYGAAVKGDVALKLNGRGFKKLTVKCWKQGGAFGADSTVGVVALDAKGDGSIVFPAEKYPHGPITVRISGVSAVASDNGYLQLYNTGGVSWNEAAPKGPPPAAKGMKLLFADDFDKELSISRDGKGATYSAHKLGWGDFSGIGFGDHENKKTTPFSQVDTYLRIRADEKKKTTGLICSVRSDGSGVNAKAPCYFECRFIAQSAIGTWPAFWVMTNQALHGGEFNKVSSDELDVIEAYGGEGPGNPNCKGLYMIASHYWLQDKDGPKQPGFYGPIDMLKLKGGGGASWWEALHIYGVLIGKKDTIYYCDNIEVARHKTARLSRREPIYFYINLAIGGTSGWRKDLSRYDGIADMYVDYVRVYQGK